MLSGIGPADHLKYHGIPVKVDLPVGKSLQSHVGTGEIAFTVKQKVSYDPIKCVNVINVFIFVFYLTLAVVWYYPLYYCCSFYKPTLFTVISLLVYKNMVI